MKKLTFLSTLFAVFLLVSPALAANKTPQVPVPGQVTMVDLGSHSCIPCKMMMPILDKLTKEYEGRAAIVFIDVWQDSSQAKRFKVSAIPTQVFFDIKGHEVYRHQGFLAEDKIVKQLTDMGVSPAKGE